MITSETPHKLTEIICLQLYRTRNNMKFSIGKINSNLIEEYKNLNYINKPFNDQKTINKWKSLCHNYDKYTGLVRDQSQNLPEWCEKVAKQLPLQNFGITLYCMTPETAKLGLEKLPNAMEKMSQKWSYENYFDLMIMDVFQ